MEIYYQTIQDQEGRPVPNLSVAVRNMAGALLVIYSDQEGDFPIPNPMTTDASGAFSFAAPNGSYEVKGSGVYLGAAIDFELVVTLFDPADQTQFSSEPSDTEKGVLWGDLLAHVDSIYAGFLATTQNINTVLDARVDGLTDLVNANYTSLQGQIGVVDTNVRALITALQESITALQGEVDVNKAAITALALRVTNIEDALLDEEGGVVVLGDVLSYYNAAVVVPTTTWVSIATLNNHVNNVPLMILGAVSLASSDNNNWVDIRLLKGGDVLTETRIFESMTAEDVGGEVTEWVETSSGGVGIIVAHDLPAEINVYTLQIKKSISVGARSASISHMYIIPTQY